ncbi:interleukin 17-like protein [Saccostrea echinata]|uniref:interleukin 17-like protein n=1 Tax=Saccostrea echinata TaxID=191078 RepID=UPI002A7F11CD|nr:interleukin 17-like protein [Saccostrea echinata]
MGISFLMSFKLVMCSAFFLLAGQVQSAVICSEPTNLAEQYAQYLSQESGSSIDELLGSYSANNTRPDEEEQLIFGNKVCPSSLRVITSDPKSKVHERTTCPYFLVASHLSTRYPKIITEARCKCQACLEENGPSTATRCEPVYRPVRILTRKSVCVDGVYQYSEQTYMKQEGCTCAKKTEAVSGSGSNTSSGSDPATM